MMSRSSSISFATNKTWTRSQICSEDLSWPITIPISTLKIQIFKIAAKCSAGNKLIKSFINRRRDKTTPTTNQTRLNFPWRAWSTPKRRLHHHLLQTRPDPSLRSKSLALSIKFRKSARRLNRDVLVTVSKCSLTIVNNLILLKIVARLTSFPSNKHSITRWNITVLSRSSTHTWMRCSASRSSSRT